MNTGDLFSNQTWNYIWPRHSKNLQNQRVCWKYKGVANETLKLRRKKSRPTMCSFIHSKPSVWINNIKRVWQIWADNDKRLSCTECICTNSARNSLSFFLFHSPTNETVISSGCPLSLLLNKVRDDVTITGGTQHKSRFVTEVIGFWPKNHASQLLRKRMETLSFRQTNTSYKFYKRCG